MTIRINRKTIGNILDLMELAGQLEDAFAEQIRLGSRSIKVTMVPVPKPGEPYSELRIRKGDK